MEATRIFMLHRVLPEIPSDIGVYRPTTVTCHQFETLLRQRAGQPALPLSALLEAKTLPDGAWFVTFDDGYCDNLEHALPLLEKYDVPATIFVTTGFMQGTHEPVEKTLWRTLLASGHADSYERYSPLCKHGSYRARRARIARIAKRFEAELPAVSSGDYMSPEQVARISRHPLIEIGAHTHTHPLLTKLDPVTLFEEIKTSKHTLEGVTGKKVRLFSYPYGGNHLFIRLAVRQAGFSLAVKTSNQTIPRTPDFFQLPRIDVNWMTDQRQK